MARPMESGTLICKCKKVTYGMIGITGILNLFS